MMITLGGRSAATATWVKRNSANTQHRNMSIGSLLRKSETLHSLAMSKQPEPLGLSPSFGFGDRLGLATPGHVESMRRQRGNILPIFAQQSIREMTRPNSTPTAEMTDA